MPPPNPPAATPLLSPVAAPPRADFVADEFKRHRLLPSGHLETIWTLYAAEPRAVYQREMIRTRDDDEIILDSLPAECAPAPLLVILHGLEGCSQTYTVRLLADGFRRRGWHVAVPHFRSCGGHRNRFPRSYHAADGDEVAWMINYCRAKFSAQTVCAVGISLGGSALVHAVARRPDIVRAAAAICAPFDLTACARNIDSGVARFLYARFFLRSLRRKIVDKARDYPFICDVKKMKRIRSLREFDEAYTAPVHGFKSAQDYYRQGSAQALLPALRAPLLCVNTRNDPIVPAASLPPAPDNPLVTFCLTRHGGHGGFFGEPRRWLPDTIARFFDLQLRG